ncbi:hypothetical protein EJ06DRAFT_142634 [Trichodelitschia bisporula]|uniref:Uncharacterized protein n=1 Tax=Trichodelitschia bisporula TaxID=703511 RepID=A0A6G1HQ66_9PEZI|nr:hypothetical protein EJ06DRAFT_142634 [Trichodelitschia bisporula]
MRRSPGFAGISRATGHLNCSAVRLDTQERHHLPRDPVLPHRGMPHHGTRRGYTKGTFAAHIDFQDEAGVPNASAMATSRLLVMPPTTASRLRVMPPATTSRLRVMPPTTASRLRVMPPTTTSCLRVMPPTTTSRLRMVPPTTTSRLRVMTPITTSRLRVMPRTATSCLRVMAPKTTSRSRTRRKERKAFSLRRRHGRVPRWSQYQGRPPGTIHGWPRHVNRAIW